MKYWLPTVFGLVSETGFSGVEQMGFERMCVVCPQCGKIWKYMSMNGNLIRCGSCGCEFKLPKIEEIHQTTNAESSGCTLIFLIILFVGWLIILYPPHFYLFRWLGGRELDSKILAFGLASLEIGFFIACLSLLDKGKQ